MAFKNGVRSIFVVLVLGALALFGCAQETAKKTDALSGAAGSSGATPEQRAPAKKSEVSSRQTPSPSSLEDRKSVV